MYLSLWGKARRALYHDALFVRGSLLTSRYHVMLQVAPGTREARRPRALQVQVHGRRLEADEAHLDSLLTKGAEKAAIIADETVREVKEIVGFLV